MNKREGLKDTWFRLLGIPFIALMAHLIFYNRNESGDQRFGFWGIYFFSLLETFAVWESIRLVILYFRRRFPALNQTQKRIAWTMSGTVPLTVLIRWLNLWIYDKTALWSEYPFPLEAYLEAIFVALLFVIIVTAIYEATYFFRKWKEAVVEAEELKARNLQTQLESLKNQINPHFLFNSLGSLSSLILEDPIKAVQFVDDLSAVYRYLLQANEKVSATLREELKFVKAYFQLFKNRFGEGISMDLRIAESWMDYKLPTLTLQPLIENAIKHNVILPEKPLKIELSVTPDGTLTVSNNLQRKNSTGLSNEVGLRNIITKYKLLHQKDVEILETEDKFLVRLPLIPGGRT